MHAKFVKNTDRYNIRPAGKPLHVDTNNTVGNCLKNYTVDHTEESMKQHICNKNLVKSDRFGAQNPNHYGIYTEVRPILQPKPQTRYQTLINDLKETSYHSYWNRVLGKSRDEIPGLPKGLKPLEVTFGNPTIRKCTVKDLINPPKTVYEVLWHSQRNHEMYKKTHNNYNIGEKIDRKYNMPPYNPNQRYGVKSGCDPRGIWAKCAFNWIKTEPIQVANKIQSDYVSSYKSHLAQCKRPNNILNLVEDNHTFGKPCKKDMYGMEDVLKDANVSPCLEKRLLRIWMNSLNKLRNNIKLKNNIDFNFYDFYKKFLYYDEEDTGLVPLDIFYKLCDSHYIYYNKRNIENLLNAFSIVKDEQINYKQFIDIINYNKLVNLPKINDLSCENQYYITSSQAAGLGCQLINNPVCPMAGIPSIRHDLERPIVPVGCCRADLDSIGDDTSVEVLLSPSIFTNYGLTFRDFLIPRSKEIMKDLFTNAGYDLNEQMFDELWETAVKEDNTEGLVCVSTFTKLLDSKLVAENKL